MSSDRVRAALIRVLPLVFAGALLVPDEARSATYVVGTGTGCTHPSLTAALATVAATPGSHVIRVTRSIAHLQMAVSLTTGQTLDIMGGFETCAQTAPDTTPTILDGAGGATDPVMRITVNTGGIVRLDRLTIRNGDEDGNGYGGGIYFRGDGVLEIQRSNITNNTAGYGGGIYAEGLGESALLRIGADVYIGSNTARLSGGGIYVEAMKMEMRSPRSMLAVNKALGSGTQGGYGGGLMLLSGSRLTEARIDTTGQGNIGAIFDNEARYGGGVAVFARESGDADVQLVVGSTDPSFAAGIRGNLASRAGGGLYVKSNGSGFSSVTLAEAYLRNVALVENVAPDGAAAYLDEEGDWGGRLSLNTNSFASGSHGSCTVGRPCGEVSRNSTHDGVNPTSGAIIRLTERASVNVNGRYINLVNSGLLMQDNQGGRLIYASDANGGIFLRNVVVSGNQMSQELIRSAGESESSVYMNAVTIAGNAIGAGHVLAKYDTAILDSTIVWQPGKTTLQDNGGSLVVRSVLASEVGSLGGGASALVRDPRFIDPERGDYRLRAASPAIDAALIDDGMEGDVLGNLRNRDIASIPNGEGPRDIGAYEVQFLPALVQNPDFDIDLHQWSTVTPGVTTRDALNTTGATGSGSAKITQTNVAYGQAIRGIRQCVHLPGPGLYAINGSGRGTGNVTTGGDVAQIHWEYRRNGGESCTQGVATLSGVHALSNSSFWSRPANPALVSVEPTEWNSNTSITVTLVAVESGVSGEPRTTSAWFDGVRVERASDDTIFRNGFD
ncbi:hypothetical protein ACQQ2N_18970 [Dokdonella sp. MW10]|uniref:hypothetical protein n=1 Tax=Dokdonella sp. MW10 TaxID=2992926 RepID=UPI003F803660